MSTNTTIPWYELEIWERLFAEYDADAAQRLVNLRRARRLPPSISAIRIHADFDLQTSNIFDAWSEWCVPMGRRRLWYHDLRQAFQEQPQ